jgi:hypothetical protein
LGERDPKAFFVIPEPEFLIPKPFFLCRSF